MIGTCINLISRILIYMTISKKKFTWSKQPLRFVAHGEIQKVCRLQKSMYGLKQSHHAWFGKFSQAVETFGILKSKSDHSVFYRNFSSSIILLIVYVDDIVITGSDSNGILSLKSFLHIHFHTKDLGMLKYFLGFEVMRSREFCYLNGNMCSICYLKQGNWVPNRVVLL